MPSYPSSQTASPANPKILLLVALAYLTIPTSASATATNHTLNHQHEIPIGTSCIGAEGLWNCMTTSFQRCGSGQWSAVQKCALGTRCEPVGLTYQFHVDFADGYLGAAPPLPTGTGGGEGSAPGRGRGMGMGWWLGVCGGLAVGFALV